jgi:hypothetical protein
MSDYTEELNRLGYEDYVNEFYGQIQISHITQLINESFCSSLMKEAIKRLILKRYRELENEIKV